MHKTWKAEQGPLCKSNVFVNSEEIFADRWEVKQLPQYAGGLQVPLPPAPQGGKWGMGWIYTYWWKIRPAGDTKKNNNESREVPSKREEQKQQEWGILS